MATDEETLQLTNRVQNVLLSDSRTQKWEKGNSIEVFNDQNRSSWFFSKFCN